MMLILLMMSISTWAFNIHLVGADGNVDTPTSLISNGGNVTYTLNGNIDEGITVVRKGDWAKYRLSILWKPTGTNTTEPQYVKELRNREGITIQVLDVSGTTILISETTHFENGTEQTVTRLGDLKTGSGDLGDYIIRANLRKGFKIYETSESPVIKETFSRTYAGAIREVNYMNRSLNLFNAPATEHTYWDRKTGLLCERRFETSDTMITILFEITETDMWQTQPIWTQWWLWATIGAIVVATIAVALLIRRRKKAIPPEVAVPTQTTT